MIAHTTLSLDETLHDTLKMIAAARRVGLDDLITDLLVQGVQRNLDQDQTLRGLVRGAVTRDVRVRASGGARSLDDGVLPLHNRKLDPLLGAQPPRHVHGTAHQSRVQQHVDSADPLRVHLGQALDNANDFPKTPPRGQELRFIVLPAFVRQRGNICLLS